jgi:hypothetical protein
MKLHDTRGAFASYPFWNVIIRVEKIERTKRAV